MCTQNIFSTPQLTSSLIDVCTQNVFSTLNIYLEYTQNEDVIISCVYTQLIWRCGVVNIFCVHTTIMKMFCVRKYIVCTQTNNILWSTQIHLCTHNNNEDVLCGVENIFCVHTTSIMKMYLCGVRRNILYRLCTHN